MKFIGITGGVGAGKSTVLTLLKENYSCEIMLADDVAKLLMEPGHDCFDRVVALDWPTPVIDETGQINRPLMAQMLYASVDLRLKVNSIVHPAVQDYVLNKVEEARNNHNIEYFFFEAALLLECGYDKLCDEIWYIFADSMIRRERLKQSRGYDDARVDAMLKSQLSDEQFRAKSTVVIDNGHSKEETLSQIVAVLGH